MFEHSFFKYLKNGCYQDMIYNIDDENSAETTPRDNIIYDENGNQIQF